MEPSAPSNVQLLRRAFGTFATGIAVIGARSDDGSLVGMTVNSLTSVSLDPPLVLFCPARSLTAFDVYRTVSHFSVSILPEHTEAASNHFARSGTGKWRTVPHRIGQTGAPILDFALASFECEVVARHDAGDHMIVVGRVLTLTLDDGGEPLVFFRSRYRQLDPHSRPLEPDGEDPFLIWG